MGQHTEVDLSLFIVIQLFASSKRSREYLPDTRDDVKDIKQ